MPLLYLALASIDASYSLVVSPGSSTSRKFRDELDGLGAMLSDRMPEPDEIMGACKRFCQVAKDFADWQRHAIEHLQRDLVDATNGITRFVGQALDAQDGIYSDFERIHDEVSELQEIDDLDEMRRRLRAQVATAEDMLRRHGQMRDELQKQYEQALADLQMRVKKVEASGGVDFLTNAPNRAALDFYLQAVVQKAKMRDARYSAAIFDLDDFKGINDTFGHEAGDSALNIVVERAREAIGEKGFIARYGGDEFVVVYTGESDQLVRRLLKLINEFRGREYDVDLPDGRIRLRLKLSAGVTGVLADDTVEAVIHRADKALYQAKRAGKGTVRKYESVDEPKRAA
jgi:diguanylate cyclase